MSACVYMVSYSPPGCDLEEGELIYTECPDTGSCADMVITDPGSPCDGAYLVAMECSCVET